LIQLHFWANYPRGHEERGSQQINMFKTHSLLNLFKAYGKQEKTEEAPTVRRRCR
jgi:hypothetical protein